MGFTRDHRVICVKFPKTVDSTSVWGEFSYHTILKHSFARLQMQILVIFYTSQTFHFVLKHLGIPIIVSQIFAGAVIGPSGLGQNERFKHVLMHLLTTEGQYILATLTSLSFALFLFLTGVKMDMGMIAKTGRKACVIGILSLVTPLVLGAAAYLLVRRMGMVTGVPEHITVLVVSLSAVPFAVIAILLGELKIQNSELGRLGLSAAMIGQAGSLGLQNAAPLFKVYREMSAYRAFRSFIWLVFFFNFVVFAVRPAMLWIIKQTPKGKPIKSAYIGGIMLLILVCGVLTDSFGQGFFFGPFIIGLAIPDGPPLGSQLVEKFDCLVSGILLPIVSTTSAMKVEYGSLRWISDVMILDIVLVVVTTVGKIGSCFAVCLYCKMPLKDSLALALIMSSKGVVDLATYRFMRDHMIFTRQTFGVLTVGVIVSAIIVPNAVKYLYDPSRKYAGYQKRNIMDLKPNSEVRVLFCIHNPEDIPGTINLLETFRPKPEEPFSANILHLMKLIGRESPIFISHQMQTKNDVSNYSYSDDVIEKFEEYQRKKNGNMSMNIYTAVSPTKLMHEDICTLALNKLTSLIILPFHRISLIDGSIDSEDNTIRTLNTSVLERAPCSVGILVNRFHQGKPKFKPLETRIGVIFLGGSDDREALAIAKKMGKDSKNTTLTVIHLKAKVSSDTAWEEILDKEAWRDLKYGDDGKLSSNFIQELVKSGTDTAHMLRGVVNEYDLILVGRRHDINCPQTTGLAEWSEFPELGVIGDLLASSDFCCSASVLNVGELMVKEKETYCASENMRNISNPACSSCPRSSLFPDP